MDLAETWLGVPKLLAPEDMASTSVSSFLGLFSKHNHNVGKGKSCTENVVIQKFGQNSLAKGAFGLLKFV